jgi:hypothetical protein
MREIGIFLSTPFCSACGQEEIIRSHPTIQMQGIQPFIDIEWVLFPAPEYGYPFP